MGHPSKFEVDVEPLFHTLVRAILPPPCPTTLTWLVDSGEYRGSDGRGAGSSISMIVGGSAIELLWLLSCDLGATQCGVPSKPQPTTWNGRSGIWRHNYSVRMACPAAKPTRIKLTRQSPRLVYHCNYAISRIQEGRRPWCSQARSLSARSGENSSRPASAIYHSSLAGEFGL